MNITSFQYGEMVKRLQRRPDAVQPPKLEKDLHEQIMEHCDRQWPRWLYVHSRTDKPTRNREGVPDFVIALPGGKTVYVECKRPGQKLSPPQLGWKCQLEMLGIRLHVVYTLTDFLEQISPYLSHE